MWIFKSVLKILLFALYVCESSCESLDSSSDVSEDEEDFPALARPQLDSSYYYDYFDYDGDTSLSNLTNQKDECTDYCYSSSNKCCGFSSGLWGSTCRSGKQQSPIGLPNCIDGNKPISSKYILLDPDLYKGKFILENDGHAVLLRFQDYKTVEFSPSGRTTYIFDHLRFHWGKDDMSGSEHCIQRAREGGKDKCPRESMELQLVHYKSEKKDLKAAINSGEKNSVVIVSILLRVTNASLDSPTIVPVLNPVVKHLDQIVETGANTTVKSTFDLTPWLNSANIAAGYSGSLTMPMCKQVVKWFILEEPFAVRSQDVNAFRSVLQSNGKPLLGNRRPLQKKFKRSVSCMQVKMKYMEEGA